MIVSLHLVIENFAFVRGGVLNQIVIKESKDVLAETCQFFLDFLFIVLYFLNVTLISLCVLFLLDRGQYSPGGSSCADNVLESN